MKKFWAVLVMSLMLAGEIANAGAFSAYVEKQELDQLGPVENCGARPAEPSTFDKLIHGSQTKASENYDICTRTNERRQRLVRGQDAEKQNDTIRTSCENAVRKMSSNPATLSFEYGNDWKYTDGGYSVVTNGSDIGGAFRVTCYMDKSYRVTNVK